LHKNATTKKNGNPKHPSINKTYQNPSKNLKFNTTKTILQKPNNQNPTKIQIPIKEISFIIQKSKKKVKQDETF
jgi:hypothetical protein